MPNGLFNFAFTNKANSTVPQQLGAILYIPDLNTPVNGYWVDKSGKGKLVQAATTISANDSLIMPVNDTDIILSLKRINEYSKYYTNDATPKTVLIRDISQVSRIQSKILNGSLIIGTVYNVKDANIIHNNITYAHGSYFTAVTTTFTGTGNVILGNDNTSFFNAKNKTNFVLLKNSTSLSNTYKIHKFIFDYLPVSQTEDAFSIQLAGTGSIIVNWDDSTSNTYNLTSNYQTISHSYSSRLGLQKNIKITGSYNLITQIKILSASNTTIDISTLNLLSSVVTYNAIKANITGNIDNTSISIINVYGNNLLSIDGSIDNKLLSILLVTSSIYLNIYGSSNKNTLTSLGISISTSCAISYDISNCALTHLVVQSCPNVYVYGDTTISNLDQYWITNSNKCDLYGSIDNSTSLTYISINNEKTANTGDITNKPITFIAINSCPLLRISGDITGKQITSLTLNRSPLLTIGGDLTNIPATVISIQSLKTPTFTGVIESFSASMNVLYVLGQSLTYNGGALKAWPIDIVLYNSWTSAMTDAFLIAYDSVALTSTRKLDISGNNEGRTTTSDSAYVSLVLKNRAITTNNGYVFNGDSITAGFNASPILTKRWTTLYCINKSVKECNRGISGSFVSYEGTSFSWSDNPHLIPNKTGLILKTIIALGINDVGSNIPLNTFSSAYSALILSFFNKGYVASDLKIINIYYSELYNQITSPYNSIIEQIANDNGIQYIDVFNNCRSGFSSDGLHPDNVRHAEIASYVESQF